MAAEHTHLDSMRRDRGECPGCDEAWEAQDVRLAATTPTQRATREIDNLVEREAKLGAERYGRRHERDT